MLNLFLASYVIPGVRHSPPPPPPPWMRCSLCMFSSCLRAREYHVNENHDHFHGSFGQIYCLNGLKIKDDSADYTRLYVRAVVYINFDQKPACLK